MFKFISKILNKELYQEIDLLQQRIKVLEENQRETSPIKILQNDFTKSNYKLECRKLRHGSSKIFDNINNVAKYFNLDERSYEKLAQLVLTDAEQSIIRGIEIKILRG